MHKKSAFFVKQATIKTVFTVKSAKGHTIVSASGSFLKKDEPSLIDSINRKWYLASSCMTIGKVSKSHYK
jgi:hypothetical protein